MKPILPISISILVAFVLTILPLPNGLEWARPQWVLLVIMFWLLYQPGSFGLISVWFVGLLVDLLTGSLFGQHAMSYALLSYALIKWHRQIYQFPFVQQMMLIAVFSWVNLFLQYWVVSVSGLMSFHWAYWLPLVTNVLMWPWIVLVLKDCQVRLRLVE